MMDQVSLVPSQTAANGLTCSVLMSPGAIDRLTPSTGQTHQLRVHMNALGVPILGDPLYPVVTDPVPAGDFRRPLQLLARTLEFTDPVTGVEYRFRSARTLEAWSSYGDWAGQ